MSDLNKPDSGSYGGEGKNDGYQNPGYQNPSYQNPGYQNPSGGYPGNGNFPVGQNKDGLEAANRATIFGLIGVFFAGLIFGILAIIEARKAQALGVPATLGMVLGWIDVIGSIIWGISLFFIIVLGLGTDTFY